MISLSVEASSLERLRARWAEAPELVAGQLRAGMEGAVEAVRQEVAARTPVRSGTLLRSLETHVNGGGAEVRGSVGFRARYARPVEEGARPRTIYPRAASVLAFRVGGQLVFARRVNWPGFAGRHMLRDGSAAAQPRVRRIFSARLGVVTRRLRAGG